MASSENSGLSRRELLSLAAAAGTGLAGLPAQSASAPAVKPGQRSVMALKHPPMEKVRVGVIGVGGRGMSLLGNLLDIDKVQVTAICDVVGEKVRAASDRVVKKGQNPPAGFAGGETDFENLCKREDLDIVYIATPWDWHTPMAICAMKHGKHAAIEVPAAVALDECWQLVDTAEQTQRHCLMLENCCYGEIEMLVLNMVRQGVFGELTHGEGAYLHEAGNFMLTHQPGAVWRRRFTSKLNGNLYPTHGLGPIARYMDINRTDRLEHLVSMSSLQQSLNMLRDKLPADDPVRAETFACGDTNTTLIRTAKGRTITLQYDISTPRPYSRVNLISGTQGTFCDYPPRIFLRGSKDQWETDLSPYMTKYEHPLWKQLKQSALKSGGHGGMDFVMNWRLVQCLLEGLELDMSAYDAAAWSSIFPLSVESVSRGSAPVAVPDFTRGQWKSPSPQ